MGNEESWLLINGFRFPNREPVGDSDRMLSLEDRGAVAGDAARRDGADTGAPDLGAAPERMLRRSVYRPSAVDEDARLCRLKLLSDASESLDRVRCRPGVAEA